MRLRSHLGVATALLVLVLLGVAPPVSAGERPSTVAIAATDLPSCDAFALASVFDSAIPAHSKCTGIRACLYLVTECANAGQEGVPCGKDAGETPVPTPPFHHATQCKCNYCPGYPGVICAYGHY